MSVYDELNDCIESAWSSDSCEYEVYSEMFDLIADAEYKYDNLKTENAKLRKLVRYMHRCYVRGHDWGPFGAPEKAFVEQCMCELGIEVE